MLWGHTKIAQVQLHSFLTSALDGGTGQLKCDGTRAETRFRLSAKRTSPFKSAGASVQSTTDSRGVRTSGSNAGYTMFRGSVKSTGYPLHSPVSPSLPLPCVTVCHHIFNWSLNGQLHAPAALHRGRTHWTVGSVGLRAGMDVSEKINIPCLYRDSNSGPSSP